MKLSGSVIILTGASSGIGRDLLELLLEEQAKVIAVSRSIDNMSFQHPNLKKVALDLSDVRRLDDLFDDVLKTYNQVDAFIANAGFAYHEKLETASYEHIRQIYKVNVESVIYSAIKMKEIKKDAPFNFMATLSAVSFVSMPKMALYSSTKAALRGFLDAFRLETNKHQHFQAVYPIATKTQFFKNAKQTKVPWPVQSSQKVAQKMLKALKKNTAHVYPFRPFRWLYRFAPWVLQMYLWRNHRRINKSREET